MSKAFKRTDLFKVPFTKMDVHPDIKREDLGDVTELAQSILEDITRGGYGVRVPMEGIINGDRVTITRGKRRYAALKLIYEKNGLDVEARVTAEARFSTDEQRLVDEWLTNNGKDYTPLEKLSIVNDLIDIHGYKTNDAIAKRLGISEAYVSRLRLLNKAPEELITLIKDGRIKATEAINTIRDKKVSEVLELAKTKTPVIEAEDTSEEEITGNDGNKIAEPAPSKDRITNRDYVQNSWRDFKKAAVDIDFNRIPQSARKDTFTFLLQLMHNELNEDYIKEYFLTKEEKE